MSRTPITVEEAERRFAACTTHDEVGEVLRWTQKNRRKLLEKLEYERTQDGTYLVPGQLGNNSPRMRIVRAMNAARERISKG